MPVLSYVDGDCDSCVVFLEFSEAVIRKIQERNQNNKHASQNPFCMLSVSHSPVTTPRQFYRMSMRTAIRSHTAKHSFCASDYPAFGFVYNQRMSMRTAFCAFEP